MLAKILKKIKTARLLQGITQQAIAQQLNVSIPTYSRFERGITKTEYHLVLKVCQILAINLHDEYVLLDLKNENMNELDNNANDVKSQLSKLICIVEEQQKMNALLLKKLRDLAENCTCT